MPKVCMIVANDLSSDNRVKREAATLVKSGFQVTVVCIKSENTNDFEYINGFKVRRVRTSKWGGLFKENIIHSLKYFRYIFLYGSEQAKLLFDALIEERADIYHAHDLNTLLIAYRAAKKLNSRLVYDSHELWLENLKQQMGRGIQNDIYITIAKYYYTFVERKCISAANGVITVNPFIAHILETKYYIKKPIVLLNCPEYILPDIVAYNHYFQNKYHLDQNSKIVLYQGGFSIGRGLFDLISSFSVLPTNYFLVLMGRGDLKSKLLEHIKSCHLEDRIFFHESVPGNILINYTASASVGIIANEDINLSYHYSSPNKLFEYMMAGLPMAGSNLPFIRQVIEEVDFGEVIEKVEPKCIAEAIIKVANPIRSEKCRNNALRWSREKYNWQIESNKLLDLYKSLSHPL